MDIQQLRYFCAVARTRSFTRSKLFDRLGRGVQLTEAGRALLPQATEILRQLSHARTTLDSLRKGVAGRLSVGCIPTITPYFLAPQIGDFAKRYRDVQLRLVEDMTPKLIELLQAGELDIAIISPPVHNPDIMCSDLFREQIYVAVGRKHRLASERRVNLPALDGERLLLLKEGHCFRDNALTVCSRARMNFVSIFETDQFSSIFPLVCAGFGISLVPEMAVPPDAPCVFLPLEREAHRRIGYIRVRRHAASTAQKAFIQWLRERAASIPKTS
jgi:LysR family hydrogen peroxide-inducible transcriptional activator